MSNLISIKLFLHLKSGQISEGQVEDRTRKMQTQIFTMKASKPVTQKLFKGLPDGVPRSSCFQRSHLPPSTKDLDFLEMKVVPSLCRTNTSTGNVQSFSTIPVPPGNTSPKPGATPAHACPEQTLSPPLSYNWQALHSFSKV